MLWFNQNFIGYIKLNSHIKLNSFIIILNDLIVCISVEVQCKEESFRGKKKSVLTTF